jgi:hypothetical protein
MKYAQRFERAVQVKSIEYRPSTPFRSHPIPRTAQHSNGCTMNYRNVLKKATDDGLAVIRSSLLHDS